MRLRHIAQAKGQTSILHQPPKCPNPIHNHLCLRNRKTYGETSTTPCHPCCQYQRCTRTCWWSSLDKKKWLKFENSTITWLYLGALSKSASQKIDHLLKETWHKKVESQHEVVRMNLMALFPPYQPHTRLMTVSFFHLFYTDSRGNIRFVRLKEVPE